MKCDAAMQHGACLEIMCGLLSNSMSDKTSMHATQ